jgi:hypothetical protein
MDLRRLAPSAIIIGATIGGLFALGVLAAVTGKIFWIIAVALALCVVFVLRSRRSH